MTIPIKKKQLNEQIKRLDTRTLKNGDNNAFDISNQRYLEVCIN